MTVNFPGFSGDAMAESEVRDRLRVPPGFAVNTYASGIPNARMLRFTETGDLLVSEPRQGTVFLLERDRNGDGAADGRRVLLQGLNRPHGIALHDGWLYVAEMDAVLRVRFDASSGTVQGTPERIVTGLPEGGNHWTRTVGVGPDGKLYVSIGSSCNVCVEKDKRRAAIMRYELDGSGETIYATGLRNSVDFDWQPGTGDLYATDNGRDMLGDDFPPCELNRIVEGGFYGWPYANGDRVPDPDFGSGKAELIARSIPPVHGFGAHTAPLGMTFYDGSDVSREVSRCGLRRAARLVEPLEEVRLPGGRGVPRPRTARARSASSPDSRSTSASTVVRWTSRSARTARSTSRTTSRARSTACSTAPRRRCPRASSAPPPARRRQVHRRATRWRASPPTERDAALARGRDLWQTSGCSRVPRRSRRGSETYRPLDGLRAKYTIESLVTFLRAPQPPMPVYPFADEQRRQLAIYLLATHP